jgi:hypothetical protein
MVSAFYDYQAKTLIGKESRLKIEETNGIHRNFPIGTFFDEERFMVYVVYR